MAQATELKRRDALPEKYVSVANNIKTRDKKVRFVMYLFADGPKEYDFLLKVMSLGRDKYWRDIMIEKADPKPGDIALDIACGTGLVSFGLASHGASVVGIDVTREMLTQANILKRNRERETGKEFNVDFILARAENLPLRNDQFSCATVGLAMRNVSSIPETIGEMKRCVKSGGYVMSMDFTSPRGGIFRHFYTFYTFEFLPLLGYIVSRHWNGILKYLANSIRRSKSPEQISGIMRDSALNAIAIKRMTLGVTALVSGRKS
ncbi:MAG: class I SAM-dependent methyltransferase [Nitrososphaerales archaeon]